MKIEIRIAGLGGQGAVFAAHLLGRAGVLENWHVSQSSFYGPESRGTLSYGDVILSKESIDFPFVRNPDILIALCQEGYDRFAKNTAKYIFFDSGRVTPDYSLKPEHISFPFEEIAQKEIGRKVVTNLISVSACCAKKKSISKESLIKALEEMVEEHQRAINIKTIELGWKLTIK